MPPEISKAYDFALELATQLITLSTGILALTIAYTKDVLKEAPRPAREVLALAWLCFFLSIVAGAFHIMGLTGNLEAVGTTLASSAARDSARTWADSAFTIRNDTMVAIPDSVLEEYGLLIGKEARDASHWQIVFFLAGVALSVVYALAAPVLNRSAAPENQNEEHEPGLAG